MAHKDLGLFTLMVGFVVMGFTEKVQAENDSLRYDFEKSRIKTIYIVPSAHWDRGWYLPVDDEENLLKQHLDRVIETCQNNPDFRWMVETSWSVEQWLKQTPDASERETLFELVRKGRIGLPGNYMVDGGGLFAAEEVNRLAYSARTLRDIYRLPINTAMLADNPGSTWALPQVFAKSGIQYYLAGPNFSFGGSLGIPKRDMPFYWEGPDGSKVLTWVCGSYGEASDTYGLMPNIARFFSPPESELRKMTDLEIMESRMSKALSELEKGRYPYDSVMTMSSGDYDDPGQTAYMFHHFDAWRKAHKSPELRMALPQEFFRRIEDKYGARIPIRAGDWSHCQPGAAPTYTAQDRWMGDHLPVLEKLSSINRLLDKDPSLSMGGTKYFRDYPAADINSGYETILKANGHGGGPGTGWAGLNTRRELEHNNETHVARMRENYEKTSYLLSQETQTFSPLVQSEGAGIVVVNPLSWERTDVVRAYVDHILLAKGFRLEDAETSEPVVYQPMGETEIEFVAGRIPSLGYRLFRIVSAPAIASDSTVTLAGSTIENQFYRVSVNENGDIARIFDKEQNRELVNTQSKYSFNRLIRSGFTDAFMGRNVYEAVPTGAISVGREEGTVTGKLVVKREGSPHIRTEIILHGNIKRIDLVHVVDRARLQPGAGYKDNDQYILAFPFNLAASQLKANVESANGFLSPPESFLPGVAMGPLYSQHVVSMRDKSLGLSIANHQAPVVDFGDIGGFKKSFAPSEPTLISRIFMNSHQANTKDQGIVVLPNIEPGSDPSVRFEYSLTSGKGEFDPAAAMHFGWASNIPLLTATIGKQSGPLREPSKSFFSLDKPNVMLLGVKQADFGDRADYILRLQETSGQVKTQVTVHSAFPIKRAELDSLLEERLNDLPTDPLIVPIGKHETVTLRLTF